MTAPIRWLTLGLIGILYLAFPNARPDLLPFNAHDSESYLASSYALTHGLGYTRSLTPGLYAPLTVWAPGMAVLLAPVTAGITVPIAWLPIKLYMIAVGLLGIAFAWLYVRRLTRDVLAADLAAMLLAFAPFYWLYSRVTMSEVPSIVAILAVLLLLDLIWAGRRPAAWQVVLGGLAAGLAMLFRGTPLGLILVPLGYAIGARRSLQSPVRWFGLAALHAACFCMPYAAWRIHARSNPIKASGLDGQDQVAQLLHVDPNNPASPLRTLADVAADVYQNVAHHIIYRVPEQILPGLWLGQWASWPGAALLALALSGIFLWLLLPRGMAIIPIWCVILPHGLLMLVVKAGGSVRYWIPVSSLVIIALAIQWAPALRRAPSAMRGFVLAGAVALFGTNLAAFIIAHERRPFDADLADLVALYVQVGKLVPPPGPVITEFPAVYHLTTGLPAPMLADFAGEKPRYSAMILREGTGRYTLPFHPPAESVEAARVGAWKLMVWRAPLTLEEIPRRQAQ